MSTYTPITLAELTTATTDGTGVFDVLMRANKEHLEQEFLQGRIKGNEYATVYLGSLQTVLQGAIEFTLQRQKQSLEAELVAKQIELAQEGILKTRAEIDLVNAQIAKLDREEALIAQQVINMQAELLNIPKQGALLDSQKCLVDAQFDKTVAETGMVVDMRAKTAAETALLDQKRVSETLEGNVINKKADLLTAQAGAFAQDHLVKMQDLRVKAWATSKTVDPDGTPMIAPF